MRAWKVHTGMFKRYIPANFCGAGVFTVGQTEKIAGETPALQHHGAISSRRRSLVSTMQVAANAPIMLIPANIKKTE